MAKCNIQVVLDEPTRVYFPGEEIKGRVEVQTDSECRCDSLNVMLEVSVSGKGNNTSKVLEQSQEFVGKWFGQSRNQYPFSFRVPDQICPYHGTLLNVTYQVHARADIPWALDPKDSAAVTVAYPNETTLDYTWDEAAVKKGKNPGCFYVPLAVFLFGCAWLAYALLANLQLAPPAMIPVVLGSIGVLIFGRGWLATKRLGAVELGFEMGSGGGYRVAEDEDAFFVVVKAASAESVTGITGITADLKVLERVVRGSGSNRSTYTHPLFESSVALERSEEGVYRGRVILPPLGECPPSIVFRDNAVVWRISTRVDIPSWPDWTKNVDLVVTPRKKSKHN